jgi:hypothetical protein
VTSLAELQQKFQAYVLYHDPRIENEVAGTVRIGASTRLEIYANAYRLRLIEVLENNFEALHTLLGDDAFNELGHEYINQYPSGHPNIRWFGNNLSRLLRKNSPYNAYPVLAEMAAFEWALRCAFDAGDTNPVTVEGVAAVPPEAWPEMRPIPQPSVQRLNLEWNTVDLWKAIDEKEAPTDPKKLELPVGWAVWRRGLRPHFQSLEVDEAWAIDAALEGKTFGAICEGLCEWVDAKHVGMRAATLLKGWVSAGMIARLETS